MFAELDPPGASHARKRRLGDLWPEQADQPNERQPPRRRKQDGEGGGHVQTEPKMRMKHALLVFIGTKSRHLNFALRNGLPELAIPVR